MDPDDGAFRKIIDYKEDINGKNPLSNALVAASNGFIYGTTLYGGSAGEGILFEYNPETEEMQRIFDYGTSIPGEVPTT